MLELETKLNRVEDLLISKGLDALLLNKVSNFAWATCGAASYVNTAATDGAASVLITPNKRYVLTNNIEAARLEQEEKLGEQGWEICAPRWYESQNLVVELAGALRLGADSAFHGAQDLSVEMARLRANLTPEEGERFRTLGHMCAVSMDNAIRAVRPGMTEYQIGSLLTREAESRGVQAVVNLIATDDRIYRYRHPLPTEKRLDRYAMLVLCGRRWGLVCSLTRLVHFGRLQEDLQRKSQAVAQVDATIISETRPGHTLGQIFVQAQTAYERTGFANEWKLHHQGGAAGYEPREYIATPNSSEVVLVGQSYAWNPSITGTKSEDTILVQESKNEILTHILGWPTINVTIGDNKIERPAVLEIV